MLNVVPLLAFTACTWPVETIPSVSPKAVLAGINSSSNPVLSATETWLSLFDRKDFAATWYTASTPLKKSVSQEHWVSAMEGVRVQVGRTLRRVSVIQPSILFIESASPGQFVIFQFATHFGLAGEHVEVVTMYLESNGKWRVAKYSIR